MCKHATGFDNRVATVQATALHVHRLLTGDLRSIPLVTLVLKAIVNDNHKKMIEWLKATSMNISGLRHSPNVNGDLSEVYRLIIAENEMGV